MKENIKKIAVDIEERARFFDSTELCDKYNKIVSERITNEDEEYSDLTELIRLSINTIRENYGEKAVDDLYFFLVQVKDKGELLASIFKRVRRG